MPLAPEPVLKSDGATKNNCEQQAASRLLPAIRRAHPHLKMVALQDALTATGPYLQQCRELDMRYLIAVQPGSHAYLFDGIGAGAAGEWFADNSEEGQACDRQLWLVSDVPLNHTHRDTRGTRDGFASAGRRRPRVASRGGRGHGRGSRTCR